MPVEGASLARECDVFCRYLLGWTPNAYVLEKYSDAHRNGPQFAVATAFDRFLLRLASAGPWLAQFADTYAWLFARKSVLRKKLILLFAILETCSPSQEVVDSADEGNRFALFTRMFFRGLLLGIRLLAATVLILPIQLSLDLWGSPTAQGSD
jgi:hypothetical protein